MKIDDTIRIELDAADIDEAVRQYVRVKLRTTSAGGPDVAPSDMQLDIFEDGWPLAMEGQAREPVGPRLSAFVEVKLPSMAGKR